MKPGRWLFAVSLGMAVGVPAEAIEKWRTPEGTLWFGDHPPEGSVPLGTVERLPRLDGIDSPTARPTATPSAAGIEAAEIRERRALRRAEKRRRAGLLGEGVVFGPFTATRGTLGYVVAGVVRNTAEDPAHDVRVGAGGEWVRTNPSVIPPGGEAIFQLQVELYPRSDADGLPPLELDWREKR